MNEFANYEISLRMKKLGFDEPCLAVYRGGSLYGSGTSVSRYYDEGHWELEKNSNYGGDIEQWVSAPTWQSAFAWFRNKYGVHIYPTKFDENKWWVSWGSWTSSVFDSFEEAQISCLKKLLEISEETLDVIF
jgi:hypothetical protein